MNCVDKQLHKTSKVIDSNKASASLMHHSCCVLINVSFKLESIGHQYLFIGLLRFILIFKPMLSDSVDMFMSRCEAQSCHLSVILHTNVPVSRWNTDNILI